MNTISVLEKTKTYVVVKIPRHFWARFSESKNTLTEDEALSIFKSGMAEYRKGKTKILTSLRILRHGN